MKTVTEIKTDDPVFIIVKKKNQITETDLGRGKNLFFCSLSNNTLNYDNFFKDNWQGKRNRYSWVPFGDWLFPYKECLGVTLFYQKNQESKLNILYSLWQYCCPCQGVESISPSVESGLDRDEVIWTIGVLKKTYDRCDTGTFTLVNSPLKPDPCASCHKA